MKYIVPKMARIVHDLPSTYKGRLSLGDVGKVTFIGSSSVLFNGESSSNWIPLTCIIPAYDKEPHVHCKEIVAWAQGATIEASTYADFQVANVIDDPGWIPTHFYRVVEPKSTKQAAETSAKIAELEQKAQELADELKLLKGNA